MYFIYVLLGVSQPCKGYGSHTEISCMRDKLASLSKCIGNFRLGFSSEATGQSICEEKPPSLFWWTWICQWYVKLGHKLLHERTTAEELCCHSETLSIGHLLLLSPYCEAGKCKPDEVREQQATMVHIWGAQQVEVGWPAPEQYLCTRSLQRWGAQGGWFRLVPQGLQATSREGIRWTVSGGGTQSWGTGPPLPVFIARNAIHMQMMPKSLSNCSKMLYSLHLSIRS